ncbi:MAG: hypothetical protein ACREVQ_11380 [Burkholderiales bacterium]
MIGIFGSGRPDHPMADEKEARRLLAELPAQDAVKALEELAHWHETVSLAEGFRPEVRLQRLHLIDDAAQERVRRVARDYLLPGRQSRFQENRLWTAAEGYWRQAAQALARGVDLFAQGAKGVDAAKPLLAAQLVRCLRACAQQLKWSYFRYGPLEASSWATLCRVYALAEARGQADVAAPVGSVPSTPSTPRQEFLRAAMLAASAPETLLPAELAVAEHLVAQVAPRLAMAAAPAAGLPFWIDLHQPGGPQRVQRAPAPGAGLRFFGAGAGLDELRGLAGRLRTAPSTSAGLELGVPVERDEALELIEHLLASWSSQPPERRHPRHSVSTRLSVTNGLSGVIGALGESTSLTFDGSGLEQWVVENVSAGGFGALVAQTRGDWLRVGALVALQPEGGKHWLVGLVRRVNRLAARQARVGVETLSRAAAVSRFAASGARSAEGEIGVLLRTQDGAAHEVRIAVRPGVLAPGQNLEAVLDGVQHVYMPLGTADRGEDYEIGRFKGLVRES